MEEQDIVKAMQAEIRGIHTTLKTEISGEVAEKFNANVKELGDIRAQLAAMAKSQELKPWEDKVQDLEKRLVDQEAAYRDFVLKAAQLPVAQQREAEDERLFQGKFIRDVPKLRQALRTLISGQGSMEQAERAIDSTLFTTGGQLSAATFDRFLDFVVDQQVGLRRCTTRRMIGTQGHTDVLTVARRKLRAAVEGTEPSLANAVGTKRRTLNTVEVIWPEDLTLTFLEDNIEGRGAETHIARLLALAFGNDLEDLAWNGDASPDSGTSSDFLTINNGWIALMLADGDVLSVGMGSETANSDALFSLYKNLPVEFQGLGDLGFFVPMKFGFKYADEVSTRETTLGDQALINGLPAMRYFGIPVISTPKLYEENLDKIVLTPQSNLYHGIQRSMTIDSEWKPRKRAIEFTITARNDYEYSTGTAIILGEAVPASLR